MVLNGTGITRLEILELMPVTEFTFPENSAENDGYEFIMDKQDRPADAYLIHVYNPSTASDLTLSLYAMTDFEGSIRYKDCRIDYDTIPKSATVNGRTLEAYVKEYTYAFIDNNIKLRLSIDTALGAGEGFTGALKVYGVYYKTE